MQKEIESCICTQGQRVRIFEQPQTCFRNLIVKSAQGDGFEPTTSAAAFSRDCILSFISKGLAAIQISKLA